ncbi:MAG: GtrA family protein [Candidatus Andersenbacteria bacterium]
MRIALSKESGQISRFAVVGALSVLTNYALLYGLTEYAGLWYILSAFVAFLGYYTLNFSLQKYWAFQNKSRQAIKRQLSHFTIMAIGNWILNTSLLYVLVEYVHMWYILAQGILTAAVSIISYFALRWIFRHS